MRRRKRGEVSSKNIGMTVDAVREYSSHVVLKDHDMFRWVDPLDYYH